MNRKIRFLIITIIIMAGIVLGVNYISNASVFDNAFGEELDEIKNTLEITASSKTYSFSSGLSATDIVDYLNEEFKEENEAAKDGEYIEEQYLEGDVYLRTSLFCIKHNRALVGYKPGQKTDIVHYASTSQVNMYDYIKFEGGTTTWDETPKLKDGDTILTNGKIAWKSVYDKGTLGKCCMKVEGKTEVVYSNFNAILYKDNISLDDLEAPNEYNHKDKYRIPYILSFQDSEPHSIGSTAILSPSDVQKALWGFLGETRASCNTCDGANCNAYAELELHKAGIAVEHYLLEEQKNNHGENPKVTVPSGSQAGSAYLNDGAAILDKTIANMEDEMKENLETQTILSDGIVRIGPFKMSDYAYAFSEHVADYSNKGKEWPHVIAGIVDGSVTIGGKEIKIEAKEEGAGYVHGSGGTEIEGSATAAIVYKDWYDQVPLTYLQTNASGDVRGDATRGGTTETINGKEVEILYKPIIDNTSEKPAGVYSTGFTTYGAKELKSGEAAATTEKLEVIVKEKDKAKDGKYIEDYPFPLPLSTFYIEVPISVCGNAESILTNISFTYRKTTVTGTGDVISTRAVKSTLTFHESDVDDAGKTITATEANPCTTYYCQEANSCHSYANHPNETSGGEKTCKHTWTCNTPGAPGDSQHDCPKNHNEYSSNGCTCACTHKNCDDCDTKTEPNCPGGTNHVCDSNCTITVPACTHSHSSSCCAGDHDCGKYCQCPGHSHEHEVLFLCEHGHEICTRGHWEVENSDLQIVYGQPMLVVNKAETKVIEKIVSSDVEVRVREDIFTGMEIICVWHGWDSLENRGSSVKDRVNEDGFFDDIKELEWKENGIKAAELGDRIVYRVTVNHTASVPLYIFLRIKYPVDMVADDVTTPEVYQVGPEQFYGDRYDTYSGGWFSPVYTDTGEETKQYIGAKQMTAEGKPRTHSLRCYVRPEETFVFFFEYTLTKEIKTYIENSEGKKIANTPTLQITSLDYKWKTVDNPDSSYVNIDFNRACPSYTTGAWKGPVITRIQQQDQPLIVKRYVVNLNKYIYDVEHKNNAVTGLNTTIGADASRGYEFATGTTNKYDIDGLAKAFTDTEQLKSDNPVYVEYGDKITYKIEIGNGKVTNRQTVEDFDYNVDKIYVTVVDELPAKYSNLQVSIDNLNLQKDHYVQQKPNANSTTGGKIIFKDLMIPKNGVTTITVSFNIEEHTKGTKHQNKAYIQDGSIIYNYNRGDGKIPWTDRTSDVTGHTEIIGKDTKWAGASSDWYVINDYRVDMKKYISSYQSDVHDDNQNDGFTSEIAKIATHVPVGNAGTALSINEDSTRKDWAEDKKFNEPVPVEKGDKLIYSVKLENLSQNVTHGHKKSTDYATQVRVSKIKDTMHPGLEFEGFEAYIYGSGNTVKRNVTSSVTHSASGDVHTFSVAHNMNTLLDPGEYIIFYIKAKVTESNMSLEKLHNTAEIVSLTNINTPTSSTPETDADDGRFIKKDNYDENTGPGGGNPVEKSSEYVKLKDLVIAGKVWLDTDRNGKMDGGDLDPAILSDVDKDRYLKGSNLSDGTAGKAGIEVRLYQVDENGNSKKVRTTYTDGNGMYTFSRTNGNTSSYLANSFDASGTSYKDSVTYQRVDKANNKDKYGNYTGDSKYINYYIEYVYDGILYKSTELYSRDSYAELSREDKGMTHLSKDINHDNIKNSTYRTDSNAFEFVNDREEFNRKYEYISFNSAYNVPGGTKTNLKFEKDGHVSLLVEDARRAMTSRSFIKDPSSENDSDANNYLWLYGYEGAGIETPETEYLKYINLGLELREEIDISLTKDVYKVKTTINGESMEYDFNENAVLNGSASGLGGAFVEDDYEQDFVSARAYGLEIYDYDYKYRVDQYFSDEVRNYKGVESELNIEITYRITVNNKSLTDSDEVKNIGKDVTETALKVQVNEIMDLYETNFIKWEDAKDNKITIKTKDENGYLVDTDLTTVEAWYFKESPGGNYKIVEDIDNSTVETITNIPTIKEGEKLSDVLANSFAGNNTGSKLQKPIYIETEPGEGTHIKVPLTVSEKSDFTDNQINYREFSDSKDYHYNKLYITGMENEYIEEGKDLDIYVKYVLDKDKATVSVDETTYKETTTDTTKKFGSAELEGISGKYEETIVINSGTNTATMYRSLKIKDPMARAHNRGIENIAQVNAYSVWYDNDKPASLVDRNSNAGNLGTDGKMPDNIAFYDDTTYKTGINLTMESRRNVTKPDGTIEKEPNGEIKTEPIINRVITGEVWDDSRSTELGTGDETQYVGDGKYSKYIMDPYEYAKAKAHPNALLNGMVEKHLDKTEKEDIPVRNVRVEFIEIVKMPDPSGTGERYYEQILQQVTWKQVQNTRTADDGSYKLSGLIPGTYIVRFTYGDSVNDPYNANGKAQKDMLIFNGQDYKSTKYNPDLKDNETDIDNILKIIEDPGTSDARDDERRRLQVNSYSEVMTNEKAEILKGRANETDLTPNSTKNSDEDLQALTDNTYMQAETVEFLVKGEKLNDEQEKLIRYIILSDKNTSVEDLFYTELEAIQKQERDSREFKIANIDFGIEYRPESEIRLAKEIEEVKLITEDGKTLVDLFFYTQEAVDGTQQTHHIDEAKSKGVELVQFVTNTYNNELLNKLINEKQQGFVFVQVDEEILQGCTVQIVYKFEAENNSEVDRISKNLDLIRYKENPEALRLIDEYSRIAYSNVDEVAQNNYTASGIASEIVKTDIYRNEPDGQKLEYRIRPKTIVEEGTTADEQKESYYGRYVGYGYYTGRLSTLDTIASLKFDKILDFVDVNLEYKQESEQANTIDKYWHRVNTEDLKSLMYQVRTSTEDPVPELQNGRGYEYQTLLVSVDDRIKDDKYSTKYSSFKINDETANIRNNDLARFLLPKVTVAKENGVDANGNTIQLYKEAELPKAVASIRLPVSKVLSAETDKNDMSYENLAEIVQFTTLTGRRTNFATTIGNADIQKVTPNEQIGTLEFVTAVQESDTAATETITLIPPTGLMKNRRVIVNIVEATSAGVGFVFILGTIAAVLILIITVILFIIRKYKKRRII